MQFKEALIAAVLIILVLFALLIFGNKMPEPISEWQPILIIVCFVLLGLVVLFFIIQKILAIRSALAIERKLKAQASEQIAGAHDSKKPQLQALQGQLSEALAALKSSKMGKGALYTLPWYMIIGPPGSGKTTALLESGMNFPYTSQGGRGIKGVGGTRNCDWWFTDQGILLDTAGRYTTELEDRDEWVGFLHMLKKCRDEKPINGVIVAISISDLINATEEEMEAHSKNIRDRIDELSKQLEMVFPVYLLFTKCDLLSGFTDFFEDFSKEDRDQMWGMTLPYQQQGDTDFGALFTEECKKLYSTLRDLRVSALSTERKSDKKRNIYQFPLQFALAHKRLGEFVGMLFRTNPFQESPILRGIFMTSGTQEGFPIDQVVGRMSEAFGLSADAGGLIGGEVEKKSYFLNHVFTKLIFTDQKLAQVSSRVAKRKRFVRWGLGVGSFAAMALFALLLVGSFIANSALLAGTASAASDVRESADKDLENKLDALNELKEELDTLEQYEKEGAPIWSRFGLYTGNSILDDTRDLYNRNLNGLFLERLQELLQEELEQRVTKGPGTGSPDLLFYEELYSLNYTYQVLGGTTLAEDPRDPNLVRTVLQSNKYNWFNGIKKAKAGGRSLWLEALGSDSELTSNERDLANQQLDFYIDHLGRAFVLDKSLVTKVNSLLTQNFWIEEKYEHMMNYAFRINKPPALTLAQLAGDSGARFLNPKLDSPDILPGQKPGTVPGVFTQSGWDGYVKGNISEVSEELVGRLVLMGVGGSGKSRTDIENMLKDRYERDLKLYWNRFLQSIHLKPFPSIDEARNFLKLLTNTRISPFFLLFERSWARRVVTIDGVKRNQAKTETGVVDIVPGWWSKTNDAYKPVRNWLGNFRDTNDGSFVNLIDTVTPPMDELRKTFKTAKNNLDDADILTDEALKSIVRSVLREPITETLDLLSRMATKEMNDLWKKKVYKPFTTGMKSRYPFDRNRQNNDVNWGDFAHLFGFDGAGFFTVRKYVEIIDRVRILDRDLLTKSADFEKAKEKALAFRKLFPAENDDGSKRLSVSFKLHFQRANASSILFTLDKKVYQGLNIDTTPLMVWTQGMDLKLAAVPTGASTKDFYPQGQGDRQNSPWALFRFLDGGSFIPLTADKFQLEWDLTPEDKLRITLLAPSTRNCFSKDFFNFECPEKVVE